MIKKMLIAGILTVVALVLIQPVTAYTSVTGPTVITTPGYYVLENNIVNGAVSHPIEIRSSNVIFDGMNHTIDGLNANISFTSNIWVGNFPAFLNNITVRNITLKNRLHGVFLRNVTNSRVLNCTIYQVGVDGIRLEGSNNIQITNNSVTRSYVRGISISNNSGSVRIADNMVRNNLIGIYLMDSSYNNIIHNHIFNNKYQAILLMNGIGAGSNNNIISWNTAHDNQESAVFVNSSKYNSISHNTLYNNLYDGVYLKYSDNNRIENNSCSNSIRGDGVGFTSSSKNYVQANYCFNNAHSGIDLSGSNDNTLIGNNVTSNWGKGIQIVSSKNNTLKQNLVINNTYNGIHVKYATKTVIDRNSIKKNHMTGILLNISNYSTLSNNTIISNEIGIEMVQASSNNQIFNNYFDNPINVGKATPKNQWNVTKRSGINIIGGPNFGGNYWSDYAGSDTDNDGIGNTNIPYNASGNIISGGDRLPLISIAISSITPNSGPTKGNTSVTIKGRNFISGGLFNVKIGGATATSVVRVNATTIKAKTPAGSAGAKSVVVINKDGQSATKVGGFIYIAPPAITSITPVSGPTAGNTAITIKGTNFVSGGLFSVKIGGATATSVVRVNATTITAKTPPGIAGARNVVVTNKDGQSATKVGGFTYL